MDRLLVPLALVACLTLVAAGFTAWPRAEGEPVSLPPAGSPPPHPLRVVGVAGCAAMACHNANGQPGTRGSEYSTWMAVDPHARAYKALLKPESEAMHQALARHDPEMARWKCAADNPLCLKCHGMGQGVPSPLDRDGAGCERCHGPAEKWKNTHYLKGFDRNTPGFNDLRDKLSVRAWVCMECHVGAPGMEVNHDLIAAGHPRLRFDFAGYYASYPRHWEECDRSRLGNDVEVRSWVMGQLIGAKAALDLLAFRADPKREAWPEFAEYDCTACHHNLQKESTRQKRDLIRTERGHKFRPGELPWATWYHGLLPSLAEKVPGGDANRVANVESVLADLSAEMRRPIPSPAKVRYLAQKAAGLMDQWRRTTEAQRFDARQTRALMGCLAGKPDLVEGWDGGTQTYLGLVALHQGLGDIDPAFRERSPLRDPLLSIRRALVDSFPKPFTRPLYDTPLDYRPDHVRQGLKAVRERLE